MNLTIWEKFHEPGDASPSTASAIWKRIQWLMGKRAASAFSESPTAFIARTRISGLGDGDVLLSLEGGALVVKGEVQRISPNATFKGVYSCRFDLPAAIDVKDMSMERNGDVIVVRIPKVGAVP